MSFALDGIDSPAGFVEFPPYECWFARLVTTDQPPALGSLVTLTAGTVTARGTVTSSTFYQHNGHVELVGGVNGWSKSLPAVGGYRADNGVRLSQLVNDLALATGETIELQADRVLGYAWTRAAGSASSQLEAALRDDRWWIDARGVTHVGTRPLGALVSVPWTVGGGYDPITRILHVRQADYDVAAFLPRAQLVGDEVGSDAAPFVVGSMRATWGRAGLAIRLQGER